MTNRENTFGFSIYIATWALICLIMAGCASDGSEPETSGGHTVPVPEQTLYLKGDLLRWATLEEIWPNLETVSVEGKEDLEMDLTGVSMEDVLHTAGLIFEANDIYLIADDGFMVRLDGGTLSDTHLAYKEGAGWCFISQKHPVNSGIKGIREVVAVGKEVEAADYENRGLGFNIIEAGKNRWFTRGQLLMLDGERLKVSDGASTYQGVTIDVMKRRKVVPLETLTGKIEGPMILMNEEGDQIYLSEATGFIEVSEDFITYFDEESLDPLHSVLGLVVNPPSVSIMDNYYDTEYYLSRDIPVMTVFLDGISFEQYLRYEAAHIEGLFANSPEGKKAMSVYKPVTNAGFAAMVTGQLPTVSGVHDRSDREPKVPTVFDLAASLGRTHLLVEGNTNILKLTTETKINLDENGDGFTDDEIHRTAMDVVGGGYDYLMVHYHSIDECGHDYGPYSEETMAQIEVIEGYVEALVDRWNGMVIITADHGMHETTEAGDHGMVLVENLFVPYIVIDKR